MGDSNKFKVLELPFVFLRKKPLASLFFKKLGQKMTKIGINWLKKAAFEYLPVSGTINKIK